MNSGRPAIVGILNLTEDSFSDGGLYLDPAAALERAENLIAAGAAVLDLGAASSHPDAQPVAGAEEIRRLAQVLPALRAAGRVLSVDSCRPEVQEFALEHEVAYLNDIKGFAHPELYPRLARATCRLVVMYSVLGAERAGREVTDPERVFADQLGFFDQRVDALRAAGVARDRLILDPGMGFFLGANPETSLFMLRKLPALRERYDLPLYVSVSRKSFLGTLTGRSIQERAPATLAAELFAARRGVAYLRTHEPAPLRDALLVQERLEA